MLKFRISLRIVVPNRWDAHGLSTPGRDRALGDNGLVGVIIT
jgi:hypothetical protein